MPTQPEVNGMGIEEHFESLAQALKLFTRSRNPI